MTTELLRHIASSRLPMSFHRPEDIEQVRALRAAGLVIALVPAPADPLSMSGPAEAAQVLAITQKGRAQVLYGPAEPTAHTTAAAAPAASAPATAPALESATATTCVSSPASGTAPAPVPVPVPEQASPPTFETGSRRAASPGLLRSLPARILNRINRFLDVPAQHAG